MDILNQDITEFEFPNEDFVIYNEEGVWKAKAGDENEHDEEIIIEDKSKNIIMTEDLELFGSFLLTTDHFSKLKKAAGVSELYD